MQEYIKRIKEIMTLVSTGKLDIQEVNGEYQELWEKLNNLFAQNKIKNPNQFSDLWEFYEYWKKRLPTYAGRRAYIAKLYKKVPNKSLKLKSNEYNYVNLERLRELKAKRNKNYDLTKLIRLCEELNQNFQFENFLACTMLVRAILDHVPPVFSFNSFNEISNNYGAKSFKESMQNLNNSSRKIADSYLHTQIRSKETLPNSNQVDFSNDLDVLLGEICRLLK